MKWIYIYIFFFQLAQTAASSSNQLSQCSMFLARNQPS